MKPLSYRYRMSLNVWTGNSKRVWLVLPDLSGSNERKSRGSDILIRIVHIFVCEKSKRLKLV